MPEPSGGAYSPITAQHRFRIGESRPLWYRVVDRDGDIPTDLATWTFEWAMRETASDPDLIASRTSAAGHITVALHDDWYAPGTDVEMVRVWLPAATTELWTPGRYAYALWRVDAGLENVLAEGPFEVLRAASI